MLSEVVNALHQVKAGLEQRLLQQPDYPALLIVDKAALKLSKVLALLPPAAAACPDEASPDAVAEAFACAAEASSSVAPRGIDPLGQADAPTSASAIHPIGLALSPPEIGREASDLADTAKSKAAAIDSRPADVGPPAPPARQEASPRRFKPVFVVHRAIEGDRR